MLGKGDTVTVEIEEDHMLEVDVRIVDLGSPPVFSDWDGGHPGDPLEFDLLEIRMHPDEIEELPEDPGPMPMRDALVLLGYTVEEFEKRLYEEVESAIAHSEIPDHDFVYTQGGYRI